MVDWSFDCSGHFNIALRAPVGTRDTVVLPSSLNGTLEGQGGKTFRYKQHTDFTSRYNSEMEGVLEDTRNQWNSPIHTRLRLLFESNTWPYQGDGIAENPNVSKCELLHHLAKTTRLSELNQSIGISFSIH